MNLNLGRSGRTEGRLRGARRLQFSAVSILLAGVLPFIAWPSVCMAAGNVVTTPDTTTPPTLGAEPLPADQPRALFLRLQAQAPQGDADVLYNLGMFLNNGLGTRRNLPEAFEQFRLAAEKGHLLAAYKVGCYHAGQFRGVVPLDEELALQFKLRAAQKEEAQRIRAQWLQPPSALTLEARAGMRAVPGLLARLEGGAVAPR